MENSFSRKNRLDLYKPVELTIYKAMGEIEEIGEDEKLTAAITKMQEALN